VVEVDVGASIAVVAEDPVVAGEVVVVETEGVGAAIGAALARGAPHATSSEKSRKDRPSTGGG
jgi:hypothetical protein